MPIQISLKKSTANPTSSSGLTLGEPVFNYGNNTLWMGLGGTTTPAWIGAGVCGASGGIAAGLTTQLPTHAAVKNYFDAVSSSFLGATVSYVATFNGATGAVTGVSSFNGLTGAVTGASLGANTFTGLQTLNSGLTTSFAHVSGGLTVGGNLYVNGNLTVSGGVTTSISEVVLIEDNIITLNSNVTGTPTENAGIEIERGTSANTQILWNESTDKWTFTNNGTLYYDIPTDYVSSFNGLTGAVGGVTTSAANTFTALQSFAQGVSSAGGTFDSLTVSTDIVASGVIAGTEFSTGVYYRVEDGTNISDYGLNSLGFFNGTRTQTWNPGFAGTNTTITFPAATTALAGLSLAQTFTALNSFNAGISAAGATLSGTVTAPTPAVGTSNTQVATTAFVQNEIVADTVTTFNGRTGAVQGVSAAVAGSYITVSAATGSVTITNTGVQTFNGLTGTIQGVSSWNGQTGAVSFVNYVSSFNGSTGAVTGVSSIGGLTGALTPSAGTGIGVATAGTTITITNTGVQSFNGTTGAVTGVCAAVAGTGISVSAATGSVTITNTGVQSFNGRTGAVQGVSSAAAGTGISISAATGAVTITNTGVQTFNGLTGAVGGVTTSAANTFTALNSFNAGISAAGITVGSSLFLGAEPSGLAQIKALPDDSNGGMLLYMPWGRIGDINNHYGNGLQIGVWSDERRIIMGDIDGIANATTVEIHDDNGTITLTGAVSANSLSSGTLTSTEEVVFGTASAFVDSETSALGTTAANQNIGTVVVFNGSVDTNRSVEFFVQASHSSGYEALKIMVIHDGTNTYNTQYGLIRTGPSLCSSYTTTIATPAGQKVIRLRATPTNTNTTFKVVKTVIPV